MKKYIAAGLCAGGLVFAAAGPAMAGNFTYIAKGTRCVASGTEEQPLVQARTKFRMFGDQTGLGFYKFILKARLVPTTAGFNYVRPYKEASVPAALNGRSSALLWVTTNAVSGDAAWKLQVRLEWDRPGPVNYVKKLTIRFGGCSPTSTGGWGYVPPSVAIGSG